MIFADASFLVAFFAGTEHSKEARRWWKRNHDVVTVSRLVLFEAKNSIRSLPLSGKIKRADARWAIEHMKRRVLEGMIEVRELSNKRVYPAARRLSMHYCEIKSFGAMDIVHVATAQELGAQLFLSFDDRQRELAESEGMQVMP
jgi:predicted nucleic acid-binding protein